MSIIGFIGLSVFAIIITIFLIICFCVFTNNDKLLQMLMVDIDDIEFRNINRHKIDDKYGSSKK